MKHQDSKRILSRKTGPRKALYKSLLTSLILHERIKTTEAKAKELKPMMEKMITRAKTDTLANRRLLMKRILTKKALQKMFEVVGPRFKSRNGGYLRILKLGTRQGDAAKICLIEFV